MTADDRVCRRFYSQYAPRILCRPGEAAEVRVRELLPHLANGYNRGVATLLGFTRCCHETTACLFTAGRCCGVWVRFLTVVGE